MSGQGVGQLAFFARRPPRTRLSAGRVDVAGVRTFRAPAPFRAVERRFYRLVGTDPREEQGWKGYGRAALVFSVRLHGVLYRLEAAAGPSSS